MLDAFLNGIVNLILFGLVVGIRKLIHKEGISSFLIHFNKSGLKLFLEGIILGCLLFSLYPLTVYLFGLGTVSYNFNNIFGNLVLILSLGFGYFAVSIFEESLFRGYIFIRLVKKIL